jgi:excisionase family DNA binding protein
MYRSSIVKACMFYTVAAAAEATGLSKSTILGAIESGQLTATRDLSGEWAIDHSDLNRLYLTIGERGIDGAPQSPAPDAANIEAESEDLPEDDGDSLGQSCDEGHREPYDACNQGPALQQLFAGPVHAQRSATSAPTSEVTWALPSALIAATLLAALGLCWIWGWSSYLFVGLRASMSFKQNLNPSSVVLGSKNKHIGTIPASSSRDTKSGVQQHSPKLTTTTAAQPGDARALQDPAQSTTALTNLISPVLQQQSTPSKSAGAAGELPGTISSRPIAVPETRPNTIDGWTVREVAADGKAVLEGPNGIWKVTRGDTVPGVGTVDSIVRWGNRWIVATSRGLITMQ